MKREGERERKRERESEKEGERERERERERSRICVSNVQNCSFLFLKGITGAFAPFSSLVLYIEYNAVNY